MNDVNNTAFREHLLPFGTNDVMIVSLVEIKKKEKILSPSRAPDIIYNWDINHWMRCCYFLVLCVSTTLLLLLLLSVKLKRKNKCWFGKIFLCYDLLLFGICHLSYSIYKYRVIHPEIGNKL